MSAVVESRYGRLEGLEDASGVRVFRGIPYARPPVGQLRFQAPQAPKPWAGVREAREFGASSPQNPMLLPLPGMDLGRLDEDCLTLNIWTPGPDAGRRPVLFWIHGGAFVIGAGRQSIYDGAALARRGDAVVVTVNYRLGPLGFLYLADLCPDLPGATGNLGLLDQIAALHWVRENIAAFGGDPENVTIFGESAGGMSVSTLLGMPDARGSFQRAIAQSGAAHHYHDRESATRVAAAMLQQLEIAPARDAGRLRELPAEAFGAVQGQLMFQTVGSEGAALLPFQPVVDEASLPAPALEAVAAGQAAEVPLLTGSTRDEWKLFGLLDRSSQGIDEANLVERIAKRVTEVDARTLVEGYRNAREGSAPTDPASLYFAILTDHVFRMPMLRLAEAQQRHQERTFVYRFDWASPGMGGRLGACHAIDLPFVFGTQHTGGIALLVGDGPQVDGLAEQTMDAWLAFAREGDPAHPGAPTAWPGYDTGRRATRIFDAEIRLEDAPDDVERALWQAAR